MIAMDRIITRLTWIFGFILLTSNLFSQDPNFYIFLCLGQSNMEGQAPAGTQDMSVDSRFMVMEAVNCSNLGRNLGTWYTATPPLCRCYTGLSPVDYFGRKLVSNLPANIKVGIVTVAVAGCKIELFDKDNYQSYVDSVPSWMLNIINEYGGNPYNRLVEIAKLAQKDGVIKGILLHQGESNTGDYNWPSKVKVVYDNLLKDLNLQADSVPLLAGEVVNADQGGLCASMNPIIATLPQTIPNSYVISSSGCTDTTDNIHFNAAGYRELGKRYGTKMLSILGFGPFTYLEPECAIVGGNWERLADNLASNGKYMVAKTGFNSTSTPPEDSASFNFIPFSVNNDSTYHIFARLNCATTNDDSYWVKMDNGSFVKYDNLTTSGWQWLKLDSFSLTKGDHILTIAYCEDGAKLDKICISKYNSAPTDIGDVAINKCSIVLTNPIKAYTTTSGNFIEAQFNKPMDDPSAQLVNFKVFVNSVSVNIDSVKLKAGNDSVMVFAISSPVKYANTVSLSYTAGNVNAKDGIDLVSFGNFTVSNLVPALALISAETSTDGKLVYAVCNKNMSDPSAYLSSFRIYLNGGTTPYPLDSIRLTPGNDSIFAIFLHTPVTQSDAVQLFHNTGSVTSKDGTKLATYRFFNVINHTVPTYLKEKKDKEFRVYPGISRDYINIKGISGICRISIFSATGRLILEKKLEADKTPINVSAFPEGVYILSLMDNEGKAMNIKFIKVK
jgi:hypothetical protein